MFSNVTSIETPYTGQFVGISIYLQCYLKSHYISVWLVHKEFNAPPMLSPIKYLFVINV